MSDITHISKDLVIYDDVMDAHHGQMDGIIRNKCRIWISAIFII
jgi:hypothetical protein